MRFTRRQWLRASAAGSASIGLAGCLGGGDDGDDVIRFGLPVALSGAVADNGHEYLVGFQIWEDFVNENGGILDTEVELVYYDDESDPARARDMAERLVSDDNVDFLIGPFGSPTNYASSVVADQNQIPMISGSGSDPEMFERDLEFFYSVVSRTTDYAWVFPELLAEGIDWDEHDMDEPSTAAIINAEGAFTEQMGETAAENYEELGFDVVYREEYPATIDDFSSIIGQIDSEEPDIIATYGWPEDESNFASQMQSADLHADIHFQNMSSESVIVDMLGDQVDHLLNGGWWAPEFEFGRNQEYVEEYRNREDSDPVMGLGYAAATGAVYEEAIEQAGSTDQMEVKQVLDEIHVEDTAMGPVEFHETGYNIHQADNECVRQWQNGEMELVAPEGQATADIQLPTPEWGDRDI